jgi:hypothetical protein
MSWAVFQFQAAANKNDWISREKAAHLLTLLQGQATDIMHNVHIGTACEDIVWNLKGRYGNHQLAAAYWSQLKARMQLSSESIQEFAAPGEQFAHRPLSGYLWTSSRGRTPITSSTE